MWGNIERRSLLKAGAVAISSPLLGGCSKDEDLKFLRIATGGRGGVYFRLGEGISQAVREQYQRTQTEVLVTAASTANVELVNAGRAEVAFAQADVFIGTGLSAPVALARLHDDYLHLVVRTDSRLRSLEDLKGQQV